MYSIDEHDVHAQCSDGLRATDLISGSGLNGRKHQLLPLPWSPLRPADFLRVTCQAQNTDMRKLDEEGSRPRYHRDFERVVGFDAGEVSDELK